MGSNPIRGTKVRSAFSPTRQVVCFHHPDMPLIQNSRTLSLSGNINITLNKDFSDGAKFVNITL